MGFFVCSNAMLNCSFGTSPSALGVLPIHQCMGRMPFANIMDNKPMVNIKPFGMCNTISNPAVAAATAAAMGVLTPAPCVPVTQAPWIPGAVTALLDRYPALDQESKLMCQWGGMIQIQQAGQMNVTVK